ncbi:MAG: CRISPR-associated endonuclease Cas2 [Candidatus Diapherotrites archaeon]|nr:CRISPR-associated endonuclease Cas2 [Candidatus Diapherotrites archaeon]
MWLSNGEKQLLHNELIVYDVNVKRVAKVCHFFRQYLNWIQNSVFEGDLTESELMKIKTKLVKLLNLDEDSVIVYKVRSKKEIKREQIGQSKVTLSNIL